MKRVTMIAVMMTVLGAGCATYDETLVDATGREKACAMRGWGGIGMRQAKEGVAICRETLTALGFIDRDATGQFGIGGIRREDGYLAVERVLPDSSAADHGVEPGDALLAIDGRRLHHLIDARRGLFGRAGDSARVEVMQGDIARTVVLQRESPATIAARTEARAQMAASAAAEAAAAAVDATAIDATAIDATAVDAAVPVAAEPGTAAGQPGATEPATPPSGAGRSAHQ